MSMDMLMDILLDGLLDSLRLVPFLFLMYLTMEYLEHKTSTKTRAVVRRAGKLGPLAGSSLQPVCRRCDHHGDVNCGLFVHLGRDASDLYLGIGVCPGHRSCSRNQAGAGDDHGISRGFYIPFPSLTYSV